jgi:ABC-type antimicrobial peptide transport system permease subunit
MLSRIIHKIWCRKKVYIPVILQIGMGVLIINTFLSLSISIDKKLNDLIEMNKEQEYYITAEYIDSSIFDPMKFDIMSWGNGEIKEYEYEPIPFPSKIIKELKKQFPTVDLELEVKIYLNVLRNGQIDTINLCYTSRYDSFKMSSQLLNDLKNKDSIIPIIQRDFPYKVLDNKLIDYKYTTYPIKTTEKDDKTIYIPMQAYDSIYHPKDLINSKLIVNLNGSINESIQQINLIMNYLGSDNTVFSYYLNSQYYETVNNMSTAYEQSAAMNFIAGILLIIIVLGLVGVFALITHTRKKEMAICLALGSTKIRLYLESFFEMLLLSLIGSSIGLSGSYAVMLAGFEYATVELVPSLEAFIVVAIITFVISFLSTIPVMKAITTMMPIQILREE